MAVVVIMIVIFVSCVYDSEIATKRGSYPPAGSGATSVLASSRNLCQIRRERPARALVSLHAFTVNVTPTSVSWSGFPLAALGLTDHHAVLGSTGK